MSSAERRARVGELELCYQALGPGTPPPPPLLLLVMGLAAQMVLWDDEFCQALASRGLRAIRFGNRDTGRFTILRGWPVPMAGQLLSRDRRAASYSLDDMADDAAGLLDHLDIRAAHVAGASMGGMIAQLLAIRHPGRVRSLVSIMSSTGDRRAGRTDPGLYLPMLRRARVDREGYVQDFIATCRAIGSRTYPPDPARLRAVAERCFERGIHPDVAGRQLAAIIAAPDRTPLLRGLRMPATVIHGAQDRLVMPSGGRATAAAIPGARLVIVPGMGHHMLPALWPRLIDEIAATVSRATEPGQPGLPVDEVSGGVMAAITAGRPVRAPRGREDGCTRAAAARRAEFARERTGVSLEPVSSYSFDPEGAAGNIEHFIGVAQEPIGLAGPLLVNGEHARGGFCVAMATAEGTLMAGHNRRGGLLDEAGGVTTVMHDHMQRAPSFLFPGAREACAFGQWLPERFEDIKAAAETTTGSGRLAKTGQYPPSRMLSTRFHCTTADAAGQKLTGKATQACRWIVEPCQPGERRLARTTIDPALGSAA